MYQMQLAHAFNMLLNSAEGGSHPFPMIQGGGLFLVCVGTGFLLGWIFPRFWTALAIGGFMLGGIASTFSPLLFPALGAPTRLQVGALIAAIAIEIGLIGYVLRRFKHDEYIQILAILFVVGLHFFIMAPAFGPLILALGLLTTMNALLGLYLLRRALLPVFGVIDSVLKIAFGLWMVLFAPTITFS